MKTVFTSSQCAHVWAQQKQSEGRTPNGSIFFRDTCIYSYGTHYLMAKFFTLKNGKKFVAVNEHGYSVSTQKHRGHVYRALDGLGVQVFTLPDTFELKSKANVAYVKQQVEDTYLRGEKTVKVSSTHDIAYRFDRINDVIKDSNEYLKAVGLKPIALDKKRIKAIKEHLEFRLKRYHELNTPEAIAKKEAVKAKKEEKLQAKAIADQAELIQKFRRGENVLVRGLSLDILRIQGEEVVTSSGARVPLADAKQALNFILNTIEASAYDGKILIGNFTLNSVTQVGSEKIVKIGCHRIALSEAVNVLGGAL